MHRAATSPDQAFADREFTAMAREYRASPQGAAFEQEVQKYRPMAEQALQAQDRQLAQRLAGQINPSDPAHPEHALYQSVRTQMVERYAAQGLVLGHEQLGNGIAAVMASARTERMKRIDDLQFGRDRQTGALDTSRMFAVQGGRPNPYDDPASKISQTNMNQALQTPAAQSYQTFDQATQHIQAQELAYQQQRQMEMQQGRGFSR
jgi:hypothetical protein